MRRALFISSLLLCAGCTQSFDERPFLISGARVLAVRSEPADAKPSERVTLDALVVDPSGPAPVSSTRWAFCMKNRALADNNPVDVSCLQDAEFIRPVPDDGADPIATGALIPADSCLVFGSETPPPQPGEPPVRPVDPDVTGGYYQPVRLNVSAPEASAFGRVRVQCALALAPSDVVQSFRDRYVANSNPTLGGFALADGAAQVRAGATVTLVASYDAAVAERYVLFDAQARNLTERTEALEVAWYATAGLLATDISRASGSDVRTQWTAPPQPGTAHLWAVIRDERGGIGWRALTLEVVP